MANNNLLADFEDYRKFVTATSVFKNTTGVERFFAYVGPNGKNLAAGVTSNLVNGGEIVISEDSFVHPQGILAKQAIARDLSAGAIKIGKSGVTIVRVKALTGTNPQTFTATGTGRIVGAFYQAMTGTATGAITSCVNTTQADKVVLIAAVATPAANAATDKVKSLPLDATATTGVNVVSGDVITVTPALTAHAGDIYFAIAYHSV